MQNNDPRKSHRHSRHLLPGANTEAEGWKAGLTQGRKEEEFACIFESYRGSDPIPPPELLCLGKLQVTRKVICLQAYLD